MKQFLRKLKLVEDFSTEIQIEKAEFVKRFRTHVDEGSTGFLSDPFEVFSSSKNEYKGHVGFDEFRIKRRRKMFDMNMNMATAQGTYQQKGETLIIDTEVNGFNEMMIPFYLIAIFFYMVFVGAFLMSDNMGGHRVGLGLPFIFFHAAFMLGIPYFVMKRSVVRMKRELEREFYFMTK